MRTKRRMVAVLAATSCLVCAVAGQAQQARGQRWVTSWATAQLLVRGSSPVPPAKPGFMTTGFKDQTVRMMLRTSLGGERVRIRLSNAFGAQPVKVGSVHIALRAEGSRIVAGSDRVVTFSGQKEFTLGPGVVLVSDPVDLNVKPLTYVAVSIYFPEETGPPTLHAAGFHTTYISKSGDWSGAESIPEPLTSLSYYYLSALEVLAPAEAGLVVALGDSITDGAGSTPDKDAMWPSVLAERLAANKQTALVAVANLGIGGNRVLRDGTGASALARLDRDVLAQPGLKWVILLEGINDIGAGARNPKEAVTAEDLIAGYRQIIERVRAQGARIIGCTLTPYEGAGYFSEEGEKVRQKVNEWIRTSGAFDAVVDFDAVTRDPANPRRLKPEYDPGDHLHPNDAGYRAMAEVIPLTLFAGAGEARQAPTKARAKK